MSKRLFLIFLVVPLLYRCGANIPDIHYYLIDYPVSEETGETGRKYTITLGVERFDAAPLYEDERLVYRDSPYEGKYYHYHRWISSPEELITEKVIEQLNASHLFHQVVAFPKISQVDFVLQGSIKALEEWDENDRWFARVKLSFDLIDRNTGQVAWRKTFEQQNPVAQKTPAEVVKGINIAVQQIIVMVAKELDTFFSEN
jgi:ABC-type uncharacterized transport system auxiliary subunit